MRSPLKKEAKLNVRERKSKNKRNDADSDSPIVAIVPQRSMTQQEYYDPNMRDKN